MVRPKTLPQPRWLLAVAPIAIGLACWMVYAFAPLLPLQPTCLAGSVDEPGPVRTVASHRYFAGPLAPFVAGRLAAVGPLRAVDAGWWVGRGNGTYHDGRALTYWIPLRLWHPSGHRRHLLGMQFVVSGLPAYRTTPFVALADPTMPMPVPCAVVSRTHPRPTGLRR